VAIASALLGQPTRYIINGLVATAVHFCALTIGLSVIGLPSAGLANFCAAIVGISTSFLGSRYFVFRQFDESIAVQAVKFSGLYAAIAILHALLLFAWTDFLRYDYRIGFLIATGFQVSLSYFGNKSLVFRV
jgi:putative flippase GtrA